MNQMIHQEDLTKTQYKYLMLLGRVVRFSRGIVFAVFSYIMYRSIYYGLKNLPKGADAAFQFINAQYGAVIMGTVAAGLACYGLFLILSGMHRNIPIK